MATIGNINNPVTYSPVDNNKPTSDGSRTTSDTPTIDPAASPKFVDRRKNPDRRRTSKKPLLDTRRNSDRRRTGRLDTQA